jgi:hypothetical protein
MSGGGSDSSGPQGIPLNYDPQAINDFASTDAGKQYSAAQVQALNGLQSYAGDNGEIGYMVADGQTKDFPDQMVTDFNTWLSQQAQSNTAYTAYQNLDEEQQGRDATMLGSQMNGSILGQGR